ncbi:hypothetical protein D3C84_1027610 [compost metagenome]
MLINEPEGGFRIVGNLSRNLPKQLLCLFGGGPWHVVTHDDQPILDALIEHAFALDLGVLPVPPAVFGATHNAIVRLCNGMLECLLEIDIQDT